MELKLLNTIEVYEISDGVKTLSKKEKLKLANKLFKEMYQKKEITLQFLNKENFVKINADTRLRFMARSRKEEYREFQKRVEMVADGKYENFIKNSEYRRSQKEAKPGQDEGHIKGQTYHYFYKTIMIDSEEYEVVIDVKERIDGTLIVHQTSLHKK